MHSNNSQKKRILTFRLNTITCRYFLANALLIFGFLFCIQSNAYASKSPFPYDYSFNVIDKTELEATAYGWTVIQNGHRIGLTDRDYKQGHCMSLDKKFEVTKGTMHTELKHRSDNWIIVKLYTDGSLDRFGYHYTIECHLPAYAPFFLQEQLKGIVDLEVI